MTTNVGVVSSGLHAISDKIHHRYYKNYPSK